MEYCYIKFSPKNTEALQRLKRFFELIMREKDSPDEPKEDELTAFLTEAEKSYFWNPSTQERQEWARFWSSTAVDFRLSPKMPSPPWDLESMYDALWNGDYELVSLSQEDNAYHLNFDPYGFPYGGSACMVALIECFGHTVIGIDDGTGYADYVDHKIRWVPGMDAPSGEDPEELP